MVSNVHVMLVVSMAPIVLKVSMVLRVLIADVPMDLKISTVAEVPMLLSNIWCLWCHKYLWCPW